MTLTEFLLARIAEDEAVARTARPDEYLSGRDRSSLSVELYSTAKYAVVAASSTRILAECEAKLRIVDLHRPDHLEDDICSTCASHADLWPCRTLRALALPYADHPDYDEAWAWAI